MICFKASLERVRVWHWLAGFVCTPTEFLKGVECFILRCHVMIFFFQTVSNIAVLFCNSDKASLLSATCHNNEKQKCPIKAYESSLCTSHTLSLIYLWGPWLLLVNHSVLQFQTSLNCQWFSFSHEMRKGRTLSLFINYVKCWGWQ